MLFFPNISRNIREHLVDRKKYMFEFRMWKNRKVEEKKAHAPHFISVNIDVNRKSTLVQQKYLLTHFLNTTWFVSFDYWPYRHAQRASTSSGIRGIFQIKKIEKNEKEK